MGAMLHILFLGLKERKKEGYQLESGSVLTRGIQVTPLLAKVQGKWISCSISSVANRGETYAAKHHPREKEHKEQKEQGIISIMYGIIPANFLQKAPNDYEASIPDEWRGNVNAVFAQVWTHTIENEYLQQINQLLETHYPSVPFSKNSDELFKPPFSRQLSEKELEMIEQFNESKPLGPFLQTHPDQEAE